MGLEPALSMAKAGPTNGEDSRKFNLDPGGLDPVLGLRLKDAYEKAVPGYDNGITVPALVDIPTGAVVTNHFGQMTVDLETRWGPFYRDGRRSYTRTSIRTRSTRSTRSARRCGRPELRGVQAGFTTSQTAYETAYAKAFARMDWLSQYARDLFQTPGFGDTTDVVQIKRHYYIVHAEINPTQIVPAGPDCSNWLAPHGRAEMGGRPFGDGTPPGPPVGDERVPDEHWIPTAA